MLPPLIVEISGTKCGSKLNCSAVRVRVDQAGEGGDKEVSYVRCICLLTNDNANACKLIWLIRLGRVVIRRLAMSAVFVC